MTSKEAAEILQHHGMGEEHWRDLTTARPMKRHDEFLAAEILAATLPDIQERLKERLQMVKNHCGKIFPGGLTHEAALVVADLAAIERLASYCLRLAEGKEHK